MKKKRVSWVGFLLAALLVGFFGEVQGQTQYALEGLQRYNHSDFKGALQAWEQGLELAREEKNSQAVGAFLALIGMVYSSLYDYSQALSYYEQALKIFREIGHRGGERNALTDIGNIYNNL